MASVTALAVPAVAKSIVLDAHPDSKQIDNFAAIKEFLYVHNEWLNSQRIDPDSYLQNRGLIDIDNRELLKLLSIEDFNNGQTMMINGFVLSEIEVAVIASVGKVYL